MGPTPPQLFPQTHPNPRQHPKPPRWVSLTWLGHSWPGLHAAPAVLLKNALPPGAAHRGPGAGPEGEAWLSLPTHPSHPDCSGLLAPWNFSWLVSIPEGKVISGFSHHPHSSSETAGAAKGHALGGAAGTLAPWCPPRPRWSAAEGHPESSGWPQDLSSFWQS